MCQTLRDHRSIAMCFLVTAALLLTPAPSTAQTQRYELGGERDWELLSEEQPDSDDAEIILQARRLLADDLPRDAYLLLNNRLESDTLLDDDIAPEALLLRGDALVAMGREYTSLYDYEKLIADYPRSPLFPVAVEREYEIAKRYLEGLRRKFLGMRIIGAGDVGVELMIRVQERLPGSSLAERANLELGDYYFRRRQIALAADTYEVYLLNFPEGESRQLAMKRLVYADLARFKGPRYDSSVLIDAEIEARRFNETYPAEANRLGLDEGLLIRIEESRAAELLSTAEWYIARGEDPSARYLLWRLREDYPNSVAATTALSIAEVNGWTEQDLRPAGLVDQQQAEQSDVQIEGQLEGEVEILNPAESQDTLPPSGATDQP